MSVNSLLILTQERVFGYITLIMFTNLEDTPALQIFSTVSHFTESNVFLRSIKATHSFPPVLGVVW